MLRMQSVEELLRNEYSAVPTQLHATVRWCLCAAESLACLSLEKIESHFEYTNALTGQHDAQDPVRAATVSLLLTCISTHLAAGAEGKRRSHTTQEEL